MRQFSLKSMFLWIAVVALILGSIVRERRIAEQLRTLEPLALVAEQHLKPEFTDAVLHFYAKQSGSFHSPMWQSDRWTTGLLSSSYYNSSGSAYCKVKRQYLCATNEGDLYSVEIFLHSKETRKQEKPDFIRYCTYAGKSKTVYEDDHFRVVIDANADGDDQ